MLVSLSTRLVTYPLTYLTIIKNETAANIYFEIVSIYDNIISRQKWQNEDNILKDVEQTLDEIETSDHR